MIRLLIATTNPNKVREIREVLADTPADLIGLRDLPAVPEPEETGRTFQENARLKARYYSAALGSALGDRPTLVVAEDSGLIIDALDGDPGVRSARYLREDASYQERFDDIYRRLGAHPDRPRTARFVCALAVARGDEIIFETTGTVEGAISDRPRGSGGFGYDPIFFYPPYGQTLAEVSEARKLAVAHRGHAFRQLSEWLRTGDRPVPTPEF
jgi:XTP/dITP diphosphohydrolase